MIELERVSDAKVDAEGIKGRGDVKISMDGLCGIRLAFFGITEGLVRRMNADAQIEPDDESVNIEPQSGTRTERYLACKIGIIEDTVLQVLGDLQAGDIILESCGLEEIDGGVPVPYIAGIEERGSIEFPNNRKAEFEIGFQFDISGMEEILVVFSGIEITGSVGVWSRSAQAIRSSGIESLGEGREHGITERNIGSGEEAGSNTNLIREIEFITEFRRQFDELIKGDGS